MVLEADLAVDEGEEGVILAEPDALAGFHLVPCWRMMIVPPVTRSPPKRFTPSRWELLSRPLRLDPGLSCAP